jgi:beta-aspartyl-peptidase (threonine type)
MRVVLAKTAVELLAGDRDPQDAARLAMAVLGERGQGEGGIILVDRKGRVGHARNAPMMSSAFMDESARVPNLLR